MTGGGRRQAALATLIGSGSTVAITVAQAFILVPLCLQRLGTDLYGGWLGASQLLVWVQLLDMGIPNLLTQRIGAAFGTRDRLLAARWTVTGLAALAGIAAVLTLSAVAAAPLVTMWARVPDAQAEAFTGSFRVGAFASAVLLATNGVVGVSRGLQMPALLSTCQVAGAVTGLSVSVALLASGWGIWALGIGLLARAAVSAIGSAWFLARVHLTGGLPPASPSAAVLRETLDLAPAMAAGSAGYLLANNSDVVLVTTIFGPAAAAVYSLTARAADGVRTLLDSVAWAVYGGFAHLVSAHDRHRARAVLHEILRLRFAAACVCGAVVVAVNRPFVTLLFGAENYGGFWLTLGFAVQMILGGHAFLANYLLRAAGRVRAGSFLIAGEAIARVIAMAAGLVAFGLPGAPALAAVVSACALTLALRWLNSDLPHPAQSPPRDLAGFAQPVAILAFGVLLGLTYVPSSWPSLIATAAAVLLAGASALWVLRRSAAGGASLRQWMGT